MPLTITKKQSLKITEKDIQRTIMDYLQVKGYFFFRNNTGAMSGFHNGKKWFMHFGAVGSGDILGMTKEGRFFSIEVKMPGKYPTPAQKEWIERVTASGGISFIARSLEDVEKVL